MTKITPPLTPKTPQNSEVSKARDTSQTETAKATTAPGKSAKARARKKAAARTTDTRADATQAMSQELTQALSLIPPNLSRIKTHAPPKPLVHVDPEALSMRAELGGQAERVAAGTLGLVDEPAEINTPSTGIWSSPAAPLDITPPLKDASYTMALLARIDHHLDVWESLLGSRQDIY